MKRKAFLEEMFLLTGFARVTARRHPSRSMVFMMLSPGGAKEDEMNEMGIHIGSKSQDLLKEHNSEHSYC